MGDDGELAVCDASSLPGAAHRERSAAPGVNGHISKPLDADEFVRAMRENLQ